MLGTAARGAPTPAPRADHFLDLGPAIQLSSRGLALVAEVKGKGRRRGGHVSTGGVDCD